MARSLSSHSFRPPVSARLLGSLVLALGGMGCRVDHFDALTSDEPATAAEDASTTAGGRAGDASIAPAPSESGLDGGGTAPVGAPRDASPDAQSTASEADAASAPALTRCVEAGAAFCDDFETGALEPTRAGWSWIELNHPSGGRAPLPKLELSPQDGGIGMRALRSTLGGAKSQESARFARSLPNSLRSLHLEFDVTLALDLTAGGEPVSLCKVQREAGDDWPGVELQVRPDGVYVVVENRTSAGVQGATFRVSDLLRKKTRVTLDVVHGAAGSVAVAYDGVRVFARTNLSITSTDVKQTFVAIGLSSEGTGPQSALYDDVVVAHEAD